MKVLHDTSNNDPLVSVVLPTYNEKGNIERLILALQRCMRWPSEYIVVDDDSPDGTGEAVRLLAASIPEIRLIARQQERGLVSAIQRGIDESRGSIVVWMDCDLSMPAEKVPELVIQILDCGLDAAIGSRYVPGGADQITDLSGGTIFIQKIATAVLNRLTTILLRIPFHDWTSGFIAIRADIVKKFPLQGDYGEYFIHLMAELMREGDSWVEVPYRNVPRTIGETKTADSLFGLIQRGLRYLLHVLVARRIVAGK